MTVSNSLAATPDDATVSLVVPVYCNESSLPELFQKIVQLEARLKDEGVGLEVIFVDDGSRDNSFAELIKLKARRNGTKVIKLTRNFGAAIASRTGFRFATGDCLALLAADLQEPVELICEMLEEWRAGAKFVVCSRSGREDSLMSRILAALYYKLVRLLILPDFPAGGFDLMLMDKIMLPYMIDGNRVMSPQVRAFWLGFTPTVLSYHRSERPYGRSGWTIWQKLLLVLDTFMSYSVTPLRVISTFGLLVAAGTFVYGLYIFVSALLGNFDVPGFPTIVVLISFFSGLILTMLGITGEYLWRIFEVTSAKPESVILEIHL